MNLTEFGDSLIPLPSVSKGMVIDIPRELILDMWFSPQTNAHFLVASYGPDYFIYPSNFLFESSVINWVRKRHDFLSLLPCIFYTGELTEFPDFFRLSLGSF